MVKEQNLFGSGNPVVASITAILYNENGLLVSGYHNDEASGAPATYLYHAASALQPTFTELSDETLEVSSIAGIIQLIKPTSPSEALEQEGVSEELSPTGGECELLQTTALPLRKEKAPILSTTHRSAAISLLEESDPSRWVVTNHQLGRGENLLDIQIAGFDAELHLREHNNRNSQIPPSRPHYQGSLNFTLVDPRDKALDRSVELPEDEARAMMRLAHRLFQEHSREANARAFQDCDRVFSSLPKSLENSFWKKREPIAGPSGNCESYETTIGEASVVVSKFESSPRFNLIASLASATFGKPRRNVTRYEVSVAPRLRAGTLYLAGEAGNGVLVRQEKGEMAEAIFKGINRQFEN